MGRPAGRKGGRTESKTSGKRLISLELRLQALELRKQHLTFEEIAKRLGLAGTSTAYNAVMTAIKATQQEPADEVRRLELERLDRMLTRYMVKIEAGDVKAGELYLKAMERRAAYLGLDAPKKVDNTGVQVILNITGDELARIYRASRSAFLQASGEPLGVANGGGDGERPAAGGRGDQVPALAPPASGASGDRE